MRYKKIKKTQKQKISNAISSDLISGNRFQEIVNILNKKLELTNQERYLYGYSLLRTQKNLDSLIILWPLISKGYTKLQEDCAFLAAQIFQDQNFLCSAPLSDEALNTLFLASRHFVPQSNIYSILKQRFFEFLWEKADYEKLERVIKSSKKEFSGILVENLGKLAFFQPEKKLIGNPATFVSHILTGGACLIARNSIYHSDIANELQLLANEIKQLFSRLEVKNRQKLTWNKTVFENLVDYETTILIQVLQCVVKNGAVNLDVIFTPGYLMADEFMARRVGQKFLSWLATENKELFEMYDANIYDIVLWVLNREKSSGINNILKLVHQRKFNPYLRLALMLRDLSNKKPSLKKIVQISDFENLNEDVNVFKNIVIQMVKFIVDEKSIMQLTPEFLEILREFYPVLQTPQIKNILLSRSIHQLHEEYKNEISLNLDVIKNIAHQMNAEALEKHIDFLCARQKECLQFLLNIRNVSKSEKWIKNIKDKSVLSEYLTLIADTCRLVYTELSIEFFWHIKSLVKNKKINKLIPLEDLFDYDFECECFVCQEGFYRDEISNIIEALNLPIAQLPDVHFYSNLQPMTETQISKSSVLSQKNPFEILDVSLTDSKPIVMQKVLKLIQQSPEQMAVFRQAQNELFNPAQRFLHDYFRFLAYEDRNVKTEVHSFPLFEGLFPHEPHEIPFRPEFLNAT